MRPCRTFKLQQDPDRTCDLMERGAHAGAGLLAGLVNLWGTHPGEGKSVKDSAPEKEGVAPTRCDGLTTAPIPHPLHCLGKEGTAYWE